MSILSFHHVLQNAQNRTPKFADTEPKTIQTWLASKRALRRGHKTSIRSASEVAPPVRASRATRLFAAGVR